MARHGSELTRTILALLLMTISAVAASAKEPPTSTTLSDKSIQYTVPDKPYEVLTSGDVTAVVVDNRAVDDKSCQATEPATTASPLCHTRASQKTSSCQPMPG